MTPQSSPASGRRFPIAAVLGGALAGAIAVLLAGWLLMPTAGMADGTSGASGAADAGGEPPAGAWSASPVEVVAAVEIIAAEPVQLLGTAVPVRQSLVASEVDGLVSELAIDEGHAVRAGAVLVRLRTTTVEQQLTAARAARQETQARLARAEADFDRLASLLERRAISQREFDLAVADRDAFSQGVVRLDAEVARLEDQFERATVRAPFAGRVTAVHVEIGEWVGRGDEIVSLVDLSEVEVEVQIAERYIFAVTDGFPVDVRFDALPGRTYAGRVKAIVPQAVPEARTFPVLVRVENRDLAVKGGMAARVMAQLGSPEPTVLVSKDAVVRRGDQVLLFRLRPTLPDADGGPGTEGMIEQVSVEPGPARGNWQAVYGDVSAGDLLVVRGNERVFPGQPVVVSAVRVLPLPEADPDKPIAIDPRQVTGS